MKCILEILLAGLTFLLCVGIAKAIHSISIIRYQLREYRDLRSKVYRYESLADSIRENNEKLPDILYDEKGNSYQKFYVEDGSIIYCLDQNDEDNHG